LKVYVLNYSDIVGGAARAAYRIHHAMRHYGVDSTMYVNQSCAGDESVRGPSGQWGKLWAKARVHLGGVALRLLRTGNPVIHSAAILPSTWAKRLNSSDADVVHLHWINYEMMSTADIGRIRKPLVWTLHDMWAFCGSEHYTEDFRWREGYTSKNKPSYESGLDINRWTWRRKLKYWRRPVHIVTPSHWLAECVKLSIIMHDWPVSVVPNAIDTNIWQPIDKVTARELLHLPADIPLLLFGAVGGSKDPRKGFELLRQALMHLRGEIDGLRLMVFGERIPSVPVDLGFPVHYMGILHDDLCLRALYSAADLLILPSRQENLSNTGVEALACGTPVVAFDVCGMPDLVMHKQTGYLAQGFDAEDLAHGIQWILADSERYLDISRMARQDAVARFSYPIVAEKYLKVFNDALTSHKY
jgi:glycosyltransferase involved in cell wall biosynthesis